MGFFGISYQSLLPRPTASLAPIPTIPQFETVLPTLEPATPTPPPSVTPTTSPPPTLPATPGPPLSIYDGFGSCIRDTRWYPYALPGIPETTAQPGGCYRLTIPSVNRHMLAIDDNLQIQVQSEWGDGMSSNNSLSCRFAAVLADFKELHLIGRGWIHLVVRFASGLPSPSDLTDKRVSIFVGRFQQDGPIQVVFNSAKWPDIEPTYTVVDSLQGDIHNFTIGIRLDGSYGYPVVEGLPTQTPSRLLASDYPALFGLDYYLYQGSELNALVNTIRIGWITGGCPVDEP